MALVWHAHTRDLRQLYDVQIVDVLWGVSSWVQCKLSDGLSWVLKCILSVKRLREKSWLQEGLRDRLDFLVGVRKVVRVRADVFELSVVGGNVAADVV